MKNRAIIFDLDGTAVDSPIKKLPSDRLIKAVSRLKDKYYLCAATGRVWSFAKPVLNALKLTDPCIISAGTQICNPMNGEILWQKTIPEESLKKVLSLFNEYKDYKLLYNDYAENDYFNGGVYPSGFQNNEPVYFLEQVFIPDITADEIYKRLNEIEGITCVMVNAQKPGCKDLHIVNKEATKEHAVAELLKITAVKKENSMGIGDGHNDLHLFNAVAQKIAMGNAVHELKEASDQIIGDVSNDGLAVFLNSLHTNNN